jgi:hypothetical protein
MSGCYNFTLIYKVKKFLATILILVYFAASTGATVQLHYCMGKVKSWSILSVKKGSSTCGNCGMEKHKGCCGEKNETIKIEKDYNLSATYLSFSQIHNVAPVAYAYAPNVNCISRNINAFCANAPPHVRDVPIYIKNCVYRI